MLLWDTEQTHVLDGAVKRAAAGEPTLVVIEGEPGTGKTALLDELTDRAQGFTTRSADGIETAQLPPYDVLSQWGVDLSRAAESGAVAGLTPMGAAQQVAALLDGLEADGPVLLRIDDLQWTDPESVSALTWLLRRSTGDRLLVCAATRNLSPQQHSDFQRWTSGKDHAIRLALTGLDLARTTALVRDMHPSLDDVATRHLWEHTAGNPLYLHALLTEHEPVDLMQMRVLPAPAEYEAGLIVKTTNLPPDSVEILRATAVLGTGWSSLLDVAALAGVDAVDTAAQPLLDLDLLKARDLGVGRAVRVAHSLARSAVYRQIPLPDRRALHARAVGIVTRVDDVFEHRMAAVDHYDDDLADELEAYALVLHEERSHRPAASYLRASSGLSAAPAVKQRRWLDSLFESVLAQDLHSVREEWHDIEYADDYGRRDLILGALSTFENENREGIYWLKKELSDDESIGPEDEAFHYRIEVVLAWARLQCGDPTELVAAGLRRAAPLHPKDPALHSWELFANGMVALRTRPTTEILAQFADMPDNPIAVPWALRFQLGWRGTVRAIAGDLPGATTDLSHVLTLVEEGALEAAAPYFQALLGYAQWLQGDWSHAQLNLRLAVDLSGTYLSPIVASLVPLMDIGIGSQTRADELIAAADEMLSRDAWVEAVDFLEMVRVARLHADEPRHGARAAAYDRLRTTVRDTVAGRGVKNSLWLMHAAVAAIWARELGDAEDCINLMLSPTSPRAPWTQAVTQWLYGLVAEARGKGQQALTHLRAAAEDVSNDLVPYRAHMFVDLARITHLLGDPAAAEAALDAAGQIYESLGASTYVAAIDRTRVESGGTAPGRSAAVLLTDREHDVLTLLASGMSYAQIARDLFVSQSTVSYHLSNIYRKAGVGSRHELTELVRGNPMAFGVS